MRRRGLFWCLMVRCLDLFLGCGLCGGGFLVCGFGFSVLDICGLCGLVVCVVCICLFDLLVVYGLDGLML